MGKSSWTKRTPKEIKKLSRGRELYPKAKYPWVYVAAKKYRTSPETVKKMHKMGLGPLRQFLKDQKAKIMLGVNPAHLLLRLGPFVGTYKTLAEKTGLKPTTLARYVNDYRNGKRTIEDLLLDKEERHRQRSEKHCEGDWDLGEMAPRKLPDDVKVGKIEEIWLIKNKDTRDYEKIEKEHCFREKEHRPRAKQDIGMESCRANLPISGIGISL